MTFWKGHRCHLGSHWSSLGLMLGHIWTLRGILGVPRTLLWLTFGAILAYPLLSWIDLCVTRLLCGTLWVICIHFLCIMSLLFFCACIFCVLCHYCSYMLSALFIPYAYFVGITCGLSGNYVHYVHPGLWCQEPQSATAPTPLVLN